MPRCRSASLALLALTLHLTAAQSDRCSGPRSCQSCYSSGCGFCAASMTCQQVSNNGAPPPGSSCVSQPDWWVGTPSSPDCADAVYAYCASKSSCSGVCAASPGCSHGDAMSPATRTVFSLCVILAAACLAAAAYASRGVVHPPWAGVTATPVEVAARALRGVGLATVVMNAVAFFTSLTLFSSVLGIASGGTAMAVMREVEVDKALSSSSSRGGRPQHAFDLAIASTVFAALHLLVGVILSLTVDGALVDVTNNACVANARPASDAVTCAAAPQSNMGLQVLLFYTYTTITFTLVQMALGITYAVLHARLARTLNMHVTCCCGDVYVPPTTAASAAAAAAPPVDVNTLRAAPEGGIPVQVDARVGMTSVALDVTAAVDGGGSYVPPGEYASLQHEAAEQRMPLMGGVI